MDAFVQQIATELGKRSAARVSTPKARSGLGCNLKGCQHNVPIHFQCELDLGHFDDCSRYARAFPGARLEGITATEGHIGRATGN